MDLEILWFSLWSNKIESMMETRFETSGLKVGFSLNFEVTVMKVG
jgi:hypothetical protein